jgi:RNA polymerase sigma-70 factor (ECF subfamily)
LERRSILAASARDKAERFLRHLLPLQAALEAYCRRSLRNRSDVADALQSAVLNAYRDFDLYAEGTNFRAWMFRFVSLEVLNRNRAAGRRKEVPLPADLIENPSPDSISGSLLERLLEAPEVVLDRCDEELSRAILDLPDLQRSIFLLRAIGEFKYAEIAEILEVPVGTVMGLLSRSRDSLRKWLADYGKAHGLFKVGGDE